MNTIANFSLRHIFSALAIALTLSTPALADCWRGGPGMSGDHPACGQYRHNMQGGDACPYMNPQMKRHAMPGMMSGQSLGVMVGNLSNAKLDEAGLSHGIQVARVMPDSAAAQAGIQAGDVITEFAGSPVYSAERLRWLVQKAATDKGLEIKLIRDQKPVVVNATLKAPEPKPKCDPQPGLRPDTRTGA